MPKYGANRGMMGFAAEVLLAERRTRVNAASLCIGGREREQAVFTGKTRLTIVKTIV
jgi:hypothetical protein